MTRFISTIVLVAMFMVMAVTGTVFAVEGATEVAATPLGEALVGLLTGVVFPVLGAVLLTLLSFAANKVSQKYGSDILLNNKKMLDDAVLKGVAYAQEFAAKNVGSATTGKQRLDVALAYVLRLVPDITREDATLEIESRLGRTKGVGASGEAAVE